MHTLPSVLGVQAPETPWEDGQVRHPWQAVASLAVAEAARWARFGEGST